MSNFRLSVALLFIVFSITFWLHYFESGKADRMSDNHTRLTNETFIGNNKTDLKALVEAFSNGVYLSSFTIPRTNDLQISEGKWTMQKLSEVYPDVIEKQTSKSIRDTFLVKKSILIGEDAELNIDNSELLLQTLPNKDNHPVIIITQGQTNITNSSIMSWDPQNNRPDPNPYHPRSFLIAKNGGQMNVVESEISYLGFSLAGIHTLLSSMAALAYYNTSQFIIANSTLSNNLYGFYSDESTNFKIVGNEVYSNIKYGLDPHSGSKDFIINSNHIFANGGQGIICSYRCKNVTVSDNIVEYNIEGIGLHWLTNSSLVKNNIVRYNNGYGIYIKTNSHNNTIMNNTILGNGNGIGLHDNSNQNVIKSNFLRGNILQRDQIHEDNNSMSNFIENNTAVIK